MHLSAMCCVICCIHHGVVSVFPLQGGIEAIVTGCKALVDLVIGDRNGVGRGGARAIAEHCTGLHTLSLGSNNIIGEEGVRVLVERCPALTALTLGDKTGVGEGGARAIVEYGRALVGLSIGNWNRLGNRGLTGHGWHLTFTNCCPRLLFIAIGPLNSIDDALVLQGFHGPR